MFFSFFTDLKPFKEQEGLVELHQENAFDFILSK